MCFAVMTMILDDFRLISPVVLAAKGKKEKRAHPHLHPF